MAVLTPDQLRRRARVETGIRIVAPALDLLLAVGDRISRLADPSDEERYPSRPGAAPPPAKGDVPRSH